jgi:hypothetical protein
MPRRFNQSSWSALTSHVPWSVNCYSSVRNVVSVTFSVPMLPADGKSSLAAGALGAYDNTFTFIANTLINAGFFATASDWQPCLRMPRHQSASETSHERRHGSRRQPRQIGRQSVHRHALFRASALRPYPRQSLPADRAGAKAIEPPSPGSSRLAWNMVSALRRDVPRSRRLPTDSWKTARRFRRIL